MASEIRVDKINSLSGVGTVTLSPTGVDIAGITTAATLRATTGIVTTLTATGSAKVGSGVTLSPDGDIFATGVTTSTTVQVGSATTIHTTGIDLGNGNLTGHNLHSTGITTSSSVIVGGGVTISESGIEASGIGITCANINGGQIGGRRNIIINGAMQIAQRGTSSTSDGYQTVDRFRIDDSGEDEACTREQVAVTSGGAYDSGFRNCLKITNGNQTSGAGSADYLQFAHRFEAQDLANSGWNYTSSSSFVTLSFWLKSSVAQAFSGSLRTHDGTEYSYKFDTPSLSANTWTKVIKTIPGNSNLTIANDNGLGMTFYLYPFLGTSFTTANSDTETWVTGTAGNYSNDMTTTWWTTNDATFEITGLQLEVGSQATPFEHRSFGEELLLCQRYYQQLVVSDGNAGIGILRGSNSNNFQQLAGIPQIVKMRTGATGAVVSSNSTITCRRLNGSSTDITAHISFMGGSSNHARVSFRFTGDVSGTFSNTEPYACWDEQHGGIVISQDAEL